MDSKVLWLIGIGALVYLASQTAQATNPVQTFYTVVLSNGQTVPIANNAVNANNQFQYGGASYTLVKDSSGNYYGV